MLVEGNDVRIKKGKRDVGKYGEQDLLNYLRKVEVLSKGIGNETKESIRKEMRELHAEEWMTEMNVKSS